MLAQRIFTSASSSCSSEINLQCNARIISKSVNRELRHAPKLGCMEVFSARIWSPSVISCLCDTVSFKIRPMRQ